MQKPITKSLKTRSSFVRICSHLLALSLISITAQANTSANTSKSQSSSSNSSASNSTSTAKTKSTFQQSWSGSVSASYSQNLIDQQDGSLSKSADYGASLGFAVTPIYRLGFSTYYSQDLLRPEYDGFTDSTLSVSRSAFSISEWLNLGSSFSATVPTSKTSSKRDNLYTALRARISLSLKPEILPTWSLAASLSGGRNFHQYETNTVGSVLNQYALDQSFSVGKAWDRLSMSFNFTNRNSWSYYGYLKQAFQLSQQVDYQYSQSVSLSLGHTNSGNALKDNGYGSNIALVSENTSVIFADVSVGF